MRMKHIQIKCCEGDRLFKFTFYSLNKFKLLVQLADDSVFYKCPDRLRLPLIFYFGHTAAVYVNKLILAQLVQVKTCCDKSYFSKWSAYIIVAYVTIDAWHERQSIVIHSGRCRVLQRVWWCHDDVMITLSVKFLVKVNSLCTFHRQRIMPASDNWRLEYRCSFASDMTTDGIGKAMVLLTAVTTATVCSRVVSIGNSSKHAQPFLRKKVTDSSRAYAYFTNFLLVDDLSSCMKLSSHQL